VTQLMSLFDIVAPGSPDPAWLVAPQTELERKFAAFHVANAAIYRHLEERALRETAQGASRLSIAKLAEQLRADGNVETQGDAFKINNSYRALYARLLVHRHPELDGLFELRVRRDRAEVEANA